ncbi:MAG: AMP-binding protein, partial [Proteobacteria bacterium]|nr:AMP-binding protein [Pseudomonadota bacterium]
MVNDLLNELKALDIKLWIEEGQLQYQAPPGAFSDELKSRLVELKPQLFLTHFYNDLCLHQLVEWQTELSSESTAVRMDDQSATYRELNEQANQMSRFFEESGISEGQRVGICCDRSIELVAAVLATFKLGCSVLPISETESSEYIARLCKDHRVYHILHGSSASSLPETEQISLISLEGIEGNLMAFDEDNLNLKISNQKPALLLNPANQILTLNHETIVRERLAWQRELPNRSEGNQLVTTARHADTRWLREVFGGLCSGMTVILLDPEYFETDKELTPKLENSAVELCLTTSELKRFVSQAQTAKNKLWEHDLQITVTGAPLRNQLVNDVMEKATGKQVTITSIYESSVLYRDLFYHQFEEKTDLSKPILGQPVPGLVAF